MNNPIKTFASKVVQSVKYLAGDNSSMPEGVKKFRKARGFGKIN